MLFLGTAGLVGPPISGEVNRAAGIHAMSIFAGENLKLEREKLESDTQRGLPFQADASYSA